MPVTINGDGSITGLAVGGLPNGTVDADTLATNSVTDVKISGMAASKLSGALPAISGASLTGIVGGLSDFDEWYISSNITGSQDPFTSWTRSNASDARHGIKGGTMSHSSGIWTFPSTGYWFISFTAWTFNQNRKNRYSQYRIQTTANNSSYNEQAAGGCRNENDSGDGNGATYVSAHCQTIFDVQNTSNYKAKFTVDVEDSGSTTMGGRNFSSFTVIKLGET